MLFSRREQLSSLEPSFTQRFSNKLGQYLAPSSPHEVKHVKSKPMIDIDACYALLGEKTDKCEYKLSDLQLQLEKLTKKYEKKTGKHLDLEQLALAILKQDAHRQAEILRHRFFDQDFSDCTLFSKVPTSSLRLALLSDELNISSFKDTTAQPAAAEFKACRHMLNVLLSDVSMQDLEISCRDLLSSCSEVMQERGVDTESLQSSWLLRMRYNNSENSLLLKCMPIDMLRDTFERQYKKTFGATNSNQEILIEALEVTVQSEDEAAPGAPTESSYAKQFMMDWTVDSEMLWSKTTTDEILHSNMSYLDCSTLHKILSSRVKVSTDSEMSEFFIQKV